MKRRLRFLTIPVVFVTVKGFTFDKVDPTTITVTGQERISISFTRGENDPQRIGFQLDLGSRKPSIGPSKGTTPSPYRAFFGTLDGPGQFKLRALSFEGVVGSFAEWDGFITAVAESGDSMSQNNTTKVLISTLEVGSSTLAGNNTTIRITSEQSISLSSIFTQTPIPPSFISTSIPSPTSTPTSSDSEPGNEHTAAIVGGVLGGILFVIIVVALISRYRRRWSLCYDATGSTIPYNQPASEKRRKRVHETTQSAEDVGVETSVQVPNHEIHEEPRQRPGRDPRIVLHEDSGWRPPPVFQVDEETRSTSTVIIDVPPQYDTAL
ncbi:hypothetical protein VNI00_011108 [Paramarasmius palmivorus]|uniref:Mid2 domain-containing protein n=1 Tax=Paramarasmius palmivorus TaxID=297713 RepID=A0AAW0CHK7_9AGAR